MAKLPQVKLHTEHFFADGMYLRALFRPAGTLIVGKTHKRAHFYIIASGEVTVAGEAYRERFKAPHIIVSEPGTKRAVYAHTDSMCFTVHNTDSQNLEEIERELIETDDKALFDARNKLKFDPEEFRELTKKVIAGEKAGFWSDWTEEQQKLYRSGDWRAFSISRGYSEEQIADYQKWLDMTKRALDQGVNPHSYTIDITTRAALANIKRAKDLEDILKSSHLPFEDRA